MGIEENKMADIFFCPTCERGLESEESGLLKECECEGLMFIPQPEWEGQPDMQMHKLIPYDNWPEYVKKLTTKRSDKSGYLIQQKATYNWDGRIYWDGRAWGLYDPDHDNFSWTSYNYYDVHHQELMSEWCWAQRQKGANISWYFDHYKITEPLPFPTCFCGLCKQMRVEEPKK